MRFPALTCVLTLLSLPITSLAYPAVDVDSNTLALSKRQNWGQWRRNFLGDEGSANLDDATLNLLAMAALSWFTNLEQHLNIGVGDNNRLDQRASISLPLLGMPQYPRVRLNVMYVGIRVGDQFPPNLMTDNGRTVAQNFFLDILEGREVGRFAIRAPTGDPPAAFAVRYAIETADDDVPMSVPMERSGDAQKANLPTPDLEKQVVDAITWLLSAAAATFLFMKIATG